MHRLFIYTGIILIISINISAQNFSSYLKSGPYLNSQTPEWAVEMYKADPNVHLVDSLFNLTYINRSIPKSIHTQNYKYWRPRIDPFVQPDGTMVIPTNSQLAANHKLIKSKELLNRNESSWTALGPFETFTTNDSLLPVSWQANVYTIDQSESNPNVVYVGTESGGIFKSEDKGDQWQMVSQSAFIKSVSSIKVHPFDPDIVYAGAHSSIFKTIDGGITWSLLYTESNLSINDILVNKANPNLVYLGTNQGLIISNDEGSTWTKQIDEQIWDIETSPKDPSEIYVLRSNEILERTEFWKSIDSGETVTLKEEGWYFSDDPDRINGGGRMSISKNNPDNIYVILIGAAKTGDAGYIGVYRSINAGETWSITNPPVGGPYSQGHPNLATLSNTNTLQQGFYNLGIAVSDDDPEILLIGCLNLWRSMDGGKSFQALGGYQGNVGWIHPDQQEIELNGTDMWVVNDGGINYSNDYFSTHAAKNQGLNASEFWGFGHAWNEDLFVGGRYHNGNTAHRPTFGEGNFLRLGGAEAATGYIQPGGNSVAYFSDINPKIIPNQLDGDIINLGQLAQYPSESFYASHYSELEFDPSCHSHIYIGRENKLYKSENGGTSFELIHEFGDINQPIMQFELSRVNPNILYAYQRTSFYGATLWVSRDKGLTWQEKSLPNADSQRAGALQIHSTKPGSLWLSFGHQNNDGNKIFRTDDYGDSWTNLSSDILDGETVAAIFNPAGSEKLYLGTNYNVFVFSDDTWHLCDTGLPTFTSINRFAPFYKANKLRMATYGNGVWEIDLDEKLPPMAQATVDKRSSSCPRDTFYFDDYSVLEHDDQTSWLWEFDPQPQYISDNSSPSPKVVFGNEGKFSVVLTINNKQGTSSYRLEDMINITGVSCTPDPIPGKALSCQQGGNDYVQLPNFNLETEAYTITAWVKPSGIQADYTGLVFNDSESYGLNFSTNNELGFHHADAGSAAWAWRSGLIAPSDEWSYVALVIQPNGATVYLNGQPSSLEIELEKIKLESLKIGSYKGWTSRNYNGLIDEVTIWNRALELNEIRNHRHVTKTATNNPGLIAYYQFNENSETIYDRIGNHHGQLSGAASLINSDTPVGFGTAASKLADSEFISFPSEGISLYLEQASESMITVSNIEIEPHYPITDFPFPQNRYWIINNYNGIYIDSIEVQDLEIEPQYFTEAGLIQMYNRDENNNLTDWNTLSTADRIKGTPSAASLSFNIKNNLEGQIVLQKPFLSKVEESEKLDINIFPNPASEQITLIAPQQSWIYVYDLKGSLILKEKIKGSNKLTIKNKLTAGQYFYLIDTKEKLKTGKLTIVKD